MGSGRFEGDWFYGDAFDRGSSGDAGAFMAVGIREQRVFLAWKPESRKIEVRPPVGEWPSEARRSLATWAKQFERAQPRR